MGYLNENDRLLYIDIETERLHDPKHVWIVVTRDVETNEVNSFYNIDSNSFQRAALQEQLWRYNAVVGHNIAKFDLPVLSRFGLDVAHMKVVDTLVVSYLTNYNRKPGHSLADWGVKLGFPKIEFSDFKLGLTPEMEEYCIQDTLVGVKVFEALKKFFYSDKWELAIKIETHAASLTQRMQENGFLFSATKAISVLKEARKKQEALLKEFRELFPPERVFEREIEVKITKSGVISKVPFKKLGDPEYYFEQNGREVKALDDIDPHAGPVMKFFLKKFNPRSHKMVIDKLWEAGWKPTEQTKTHLEFLRDTSRRPLTPEEQEKKRELERYGWKINETNLATLPPSAPKEYQKLAEYLTVASRVSTIESWLKVWCFTDGRIHGNFLPIGCWTHRMAHQNPNMANIPGIVDRTGSKALYGAEMREMWTVPEGHLLVGTDAGGIQMRIFCHYTKDEELKYNILHGDVHTMHAERLGGVPRPKAKTFIYAWLLGAGDRKVAEILEVPFNEGKERSEKFLASYPTLKKLKEVDIPKFADNGYFRALDGRYIICRSEHKMLAGMLQSGEAIVMKLASIIWEKDLEELGITSYMLVNFVHDEWQTEVWAQSDSMREWKVAEIVGWVQAEAIRKAGEILGLFIPLAGAYDIGRNWKETH